ncbi:L-aminoadipate-semialdehyde dehydrogenase-phosphopantetheinyl transferase [Acipenser ruthenus]|uniref:L-aminoadipate-semialdehyde dehydrogenase-phosphopantetheinyl transferase n=1 Tax=Acipenser ruthenus TaxID=7906 RepID=A0A444UMG1_ACIRT|nr:L-aminoadipate-semialdehyde dehydrogenase-phosphopantetheinyl transferase [Acipenser ruthenus]
MFILSKVFYKQENPYKILTDLLAFCTECMLDSHHHVAVALGKPDGPSQKLDDGLLNPTPSQFITLSFDDLVASAIPMTEEDHEYWVGFQSKQEAPGRQRTSSS